MMNIQDIEKSVHLAKSLEDKMALAVLYAQIVTGGKDKVYDAINLEKKLIQDTSYLVCDFEVDESNTDRLLHVMSEGYLTGGHTRLCERLSLMGHMPSDLLLTRKPNNLVIQRLQEYFTDIFCTYCDDIKENILKQLKVLARYRKIILYIHPDDIMLVVSLGLLKLLKSNIQVYFVNHADHLFSFGKSLPNVMFQISNRGYEIDSEISNSSYRNTFLGIPVNNNTEPTFNMNDNSFVMAGSSYKMRPNKEFSAPRLVDCILSKNESYTFTIIGARKMDYWWWRLKFKFKKRLITYDELEYKDYVDVVERSGACVDTLPITGGTAFVEMFMFGLTPIGINSGVSGYTPLDMIKVNDIDEIVLKGLRTGCHELYSEVQNVHGMKSVEIRYLDALKGNYHDIPASLKHNANNMELFVRTKKQKISLATVKYLFSIQSLTFYQKASLLRSHFKIHQFFACISLRMLLLFGNKIREFFTHLKFRIKGV